MAPRETHPGVLTRGEVVAAAGIIVLLLALVAGGIWYVRREASRTVELEQADAILADQKARRAAEEKERAAVEAREDEAFDAKANDARGDAQRAADLLREIRSRIHTD